MGPSFPASVRNLRDNFYLPTRSGDNATSNDSTNSVDSVAIRQTKNLLLSAEA